jgi:hypothetical protein
MSSRQNSLPIDDSASFAKSFEQQVNKELVVASFEEGSQPSIHLDPNPLSRGLQVPSRSKSPSSGFEYPAILQKFDIGKEDWKRFTNEVSSHASLTKGQWTETIGRASGAVLIGSFLVGAFSIIPGIVVGHKWRQKQEKINFKAADESGALLECIQKWNQDFFFPRKLAVR